jgi:hypothetical protein
MDLEKEQESLQMEALRMFEKIAGLSNDGVSESELEPMISQANSLVERAAALNGPLKKLRHKRQLLFWVKVFSPTVIFVLIIISIQHV